jgi:F-type H+-transporting ATPase subunit b
VKPFLSAVSQSSPLHNRRPKRPQVIRRIPWADILKQAVNFAILAGALVYFLKKPISSFLRERSEQLRKSIEDAARAREEAAEKLSAIESRMARLSDEIAGMNRKMDAEAEEAAALARPPRRVERSRYRPGRRGPGSEEGRQELRREAAALATTAAEEICRR